jgi:zinc transporter ZupT
LFPSVLNLPLLATLVAILSAAASVALLGRRGMARTLVPLSGGLLAGIAVFGLIPEIAREIGWPYGIVFAAAGYGLLMVFDRFVYPVCPSCSHHHDHDLAGASLHGFAGPLLIAAAVHALLDGWGLVTIQIAARSAPRAATAFAFAILLHKIPEGLALGGILRASLGSARTAIFRCAAAELATLVGGAFGLWLTPAAWISYPLAIAAGTFLFLGIHAVHGDWKRRGALPAFVPALAGAAGAAMLQRGLLFIR